MSCQKDKVGDGPQSNPSMARPWPHTLLVTHCKLRLLVSRIVLRIASTVDTFQHRHLVAGVLSCRQTCTSPPSTQLVVTCANSSSSRTASRFQKRLCGNWPYRQDTATFCFLWRTWTCGQGSSSNLVQEQGGAANWMTKSEAQAAAQYASHNWHDRSKNMLYMNGWT